MTRRGWSEEADAELIRRVNAGERYKVIAAAMGRPEYAILARTADLRDEGRLDYRKRPWSPAQVGDAIAAVERGERYRRVAKAFGVTPRALSQQVYRARKAARERAQALAEAGDSEDQLNLELQAA